MYPVSVAIDCWLLSVQQFQNYCQFSQDQLGNKQREDSCGNFVGVTESEICFHVSFFTIPHLRCFDTLVGKWHVACKM